MIGFPASMTSFSPFADSLTPASIGPFGDIGDGAYVPLQDIDNTFQYNGAVSWTKGNHNFKFGGEPDPPAGSQRAECLRSWCLQL